MALYGGVRFKQRLARNVLPHPPYSTDLATSNLELSKNAIRGENFGDEEEVIEEVKKMDAIKNSDWYKKETDATVCLWHKTVDLMEII